MKLETIKIQFFCDFCHPPFFVCFPSLRLHVLHLWEFSVKTYGWEAITELDLSLDDQINEWAFTPVVWLYASPGRAGILFNNLIMVFSRTSEELQLVCAYVVSWIDQKSDRPSLFHHSMCTNGACSLEESQDKGRTNQYSVFIDAKHQSLYRSLGVRPCPCACVSIGFTHIMIWPILAALGNAVKIAYKLVLTCLADILQHGRNGHVTIVPRTSCNKRQYIWWRERGCNS